MPTENCANLCFFFFIFNFFLFVFLKWRKIFNEVNIKIVFVNIKKLWKKIPERKNKEGKTFENQHIYCPFSVGDGGDKFNTFSNYKSNDKKEGKGGTLFLLLFICSRNIKICSHKSRRKRLKNFFFQIDCLSRIWNLIRLRNSSSW